MTTKIPISLISDPDDVLGNPALNGAGYLTYAADGAISGHRVVRASTSSKVRYADSGTAADAHLVIGVTTGAADDEDTLEVQVRGEMTEPSWNWVADLPIFCGPNGVLTQTAPTSGFQLIVGIAIAPTKIIIDVKQPIIL